VPQILNAISWRELRDLDMVVTNNFGEGDSTNSYADAVGLAVSDYSVDAGGETWIYRYGQTFVGANDWRAEILGWDYAEWRIPSLPGQHPAGGDAYMIARGLNASFL
jgi:hypothetical protein